MAKAPKKAPPKKNGRPTKRTDKVIKKIVDGLSAGTPLTVLCKPVDMPGIRTVYDWMKADDELSADIARAREMGFDAIAYDGLEIVDDVNEDPASRRVRADYRLKLLAKWDPKRYGEKLDVTSGGEKIQREAGETEKFSRLAALMQEKRIAGLLPDHSGGED